MAELHGVELRILNVLISNNIVRFNENELMDLKSILSKDSLLEYGYTKQQIANSKNIYLLSQRGYMKLVSMMDNGNDMKWKVMDSIVDKYFNMQEAVKQISKMDEMILATIKGGSISERAIACGELVGLVKEEAKMKLLFHFKGGIKRIRIIYYSYLVIIHIKVSFRANKNNRR